MSTAIPVDAPVPPVDTDGSGDQSVSPEPLSEPIEKRKREDGDNLDPSPASDLPKQQHPLWKTSLCSYFRRSDGKCSHGDTCRFAHSESELRPRPDNTWDPTSERVKKMARKEEENGNEEGRCGEAVMNPMMTEAIAGANDGDSVAGEFALTKCLVNLPMSWTPDKLRDFLEQQGISFLSAKKKKGMVVGFITFESVAQLKIAQEELDGKAVGNKSLKVSDVIPRSLEMKNNATLPPFQTMQQAGKSALSSVIDNQEPMNITEDGDTKCENLPTSGEDLKCRSVRDAVTPLAHLPYAEQLEHKKSSLRKTLKKLTQSARKACPSGVPLPEWVLKAREIGGLPCPLEGILEAPLINGYRNKCEFSVGYSLQGKPTVGFSLGNFREGITAVEEPVDCPNVSRIACRYAAIFQDFLQNSSFPIWNRLNNTGFWRQLTVREGRMSSNNDTTEDSGWSVSEVLLMVQVCTVGLDEGLVNAEFQRMTQAFSDGAATESPCLPLTSVVVQDHTGISNVAPADAPLRSLPIGKDGGDSEHATLNDKDDAGKDDTGISNVAPADAPLRSLPIGKDGSDSEQATINDKDDAGKDDTGISNVAPADAPLHSLPIGKDGSDSEQATINDRDDAGIHDCISNLRFRISPTAFFQVNTLAAEKLYSLAGDWAGLGPDTLLFDICCGTGTIGLTLAHRVGMVVGIEMNASAVSDAKRNAEINGIRNCRFICSKAEDVMGSLLKKYATLPQKEDEVPEEKEKGDKQINSEGGKLESTENKGRSDAKQQNGDNNQSASLKVEEGQEEKRQPAEDSTHSSSHQFKNIVAIVDPPRVGLHPTVIKVLRTHPTLRRLVYISCNPDSLVANAIELCTPSAPAPAPAGNSSEKGKNNNNNKNNRGWRHMSSAGLARHRAKSMPVSEPFKPIKAMAVDLFPHTPHCELVMLLER